MRSLILSAIAAVTFAFAGLTGLLATGLINVEAIVQHAGLDIILFLVGMMCLVGYLEEKHFFEYIIAKVVDRIGHRAHLTSVGSIVRHKCFSEGIALSP